MQKAVRMPAAFLAILKFKVSQTLEVHHKVNPKSARRAF